MDYVQQAWAMYIISSGAMLAMMIAAFVIAFHTDATPTEKKDEGAKVKGGEM